MGVGGYDGMAAIDEVVKKLGNGEKIDGDKAMEILKGIKSKPARPDHDRPGDARHRADRLHPQGGEA